MARSAAFLALLAKAEATQKLPYDLGFHMVYRHFKGSRVMLTDLARHHHYYNQAWCVYTHMTRADGTMDENTGRTFVRPLRYAPGVEEGEPPHTHGEAWLDKMIWPDGGIRARFWPEAQMPASWLQKLDAIAPSVRS